jgi:arylsulfatase A
MSFAPRGLLRIGSLALGLAVAYAAGGMALGATAPAASPARRPNILFILADDLGYHSLGVTGQKMIQTPHLDRLASRGLQLTNFYAAQLCSPSRCNLMTSLHSGHAQIRGNYELGGYEDATEFGQMPLAPNQQTMGTTLQTAHYTTALIGKWGLGGPNSTGVPTRQGLDFFYGYLDQKHAQNYYPTHLWRNETAEPLGNAYLNHHQKFPANKDPNDPAAYAGYRGKVYSCDVMTDEAVRFIRGHREQPFYLEMAYTLPHMALQVPERALQPYVGKFEEKPYLGTKGEGYLPNRTPRATYAAMITLLDEYVGRLVATLEEAGLANNTLIIFTADNGAAVAGGCQADFFGCSGALRGRKGSLYEGGVKVPFIAAWPGVIAPGTKSEHLAAIWDLMPTFLDAAGATVPRNIDGISMLPTLRGQSAAQQRHEFLYWESHPFRPGGVDGAQAVRFGSWKAVRMNVHQPKATPVIELYQLSDDPSEKNNVAAQHPDIVKTAADYMATRQLGLIPDWNYYRSAEAEGN